MKQCLPYFKECLVYPGEYTPLQGAEKLMEDFKANKKNAIAIPLLNMDEYPDYFKVEVQVPGVKREEIFIHVHDNILSIAVLHRDCEELKKKLQIHEFDGEYFERHILLPDNADSAFVSAEYRSGMLKLYIPKADESSKTNNNQVVVY